MSAKPFTEKQRRRLCEQAGYGHREINNWGDGDLPAPFAEGDLVYAESIETADRLRGLEPGYFVVCAGFSIDEGDAWYFRVCQTKQDCSGRLHVAYAARSTFTDDVDYMAPFTLIETADPEGLAERERVLAEGWSYTNRWVTCPTCGNVRRAAAVPEGSDDRDKSKLAWAAMQANPPEGCATYIAYLTRLEEAEAAIERGDLGESVKPADLRRPAAALPEGTQP